MATNVELYEALKPTIGEEAAKMIAEVVPPTRELATRLDVMAVAQKVSDLRAEMHAETTRTIRWVVGAMIPLYVGTFGGLLAALLKA